MNTLQFEIGCRDCLKSNGYEYSENINSDIVNNIFEKTEYQMMKIIEKIYKSKNRFCTFCLGSNLEILEIKIDSNPIYDFDKLVLRCIKNKEYMLMFDVSKIDNEIYVNPGGNEKFDYDFLKSSLENILEIIRTNCSNLTKYPQNSNGNFNICVTQNKSETNNAIRVERFRCHGLKLDEVLNGLLPYFDQVGMFKN